MTSTPPRRPARTILALLLLLGPLPARGQGVVDPARTYWGDLDAFFGRQSEVALALVERTLLRFPPRLPEPEMRPLALLLLDGVLHDEAAPARPAVRDFYHAFLEAAADEMASTRPGRGAIIWKLYNHGFVVRTRSVTVAFDLVDGSSAGAEGFALPGEILEQIAGQCDVLFISHLHADHADPAVARLFLERGRPVVGPIGVFADSLLDARLIHPERETHRRQPLSVRGGAVDLEIVVYPGYQDDIPNNVTAVVTPDGVTVLHTGDESRVEDFVWIDEIAAHLDVDVLLPNCWAPELPRLVQGVKPALVITGHENELGHSVDHREPFWLTRDRLHGSGYPLVLMSWGESCFYTPDPVPAPDPIPAPDPEPGR